MSYTRDTTLAATEPFTLDEMKNYLRVDAGFTQDDALILGLISAVREHAELLTSRSIAQRTFCFVLDSFPYYTDTIQSQLAYPPSYYSLPRYSTTLWNYSQMIKLTRDPVKSVRRIRYVDTNGNAQIMLASQSYLDLALGADPTQISSANSPFTADYVGQTLTIVAGGGFTAGDYTIESVATGTATLDRAAGTASSTGGAGYITADFVVDLMSEPCRIFPVPGNYWPPCLYVPNAVQIDFTAGYDANTAAAPTVTTITQTPYEQQPDQVVCLAMPNRLRQGMQMLASQWYDDRSNLDTEKIDSFLQGNSVVDFAPTRG